MKIVYICYYLLLLYYWFQVKNIEISQIYLNTEYMIIYVYIYIYICTWIRYIFVRNYDFIYMIINNLTMNLFWYPANGGYSLVFWYPNQWGLFIGTLIPNQWGSFIGILIPKPMGVIHWYSDAQSRGYSVTIVIRLLRIITFEYLNCFESLKLHIWFWKCLSIWTILSH